jgi:hypothetical protein
MRFLAAALTVLFLLAGCSEPTPEPAQDAGALEATPSTSSSASSATAAPPPSAPFASESDLSYSAATDETACAFVVVAAQCMGGGGAHVQVLAVNGTPTRLQLALTWDGGPAGTTLTVLFGWLPAGEDHYAYADDYAASGPGPIAVDWDLTSIPASTEWALIVSSMQMAGAEGVAASYGPAVAFEVAGTLTAVG